MMAPVLIFMFLPFWLGWTVLLRPLGREILWLPWGLASAPRSLWSGGREPPWLGELLHKGFLSRAGRETSRAFSGPGFLCAAFAHRCVRFQVGRGRDFAARCSLRRAPLCLVWACI